MTRIARLACALALIASVSAGACVGADDEPETGLEAYLRELDRIIARQQTGFVRVVRAIIRVSDNASVDDVRQSMDRLLTEYDDVTTVARNNLGSLEPPGEAAEEHQTIVEAYGQMQQELTTGRRSIESATTRDEIIDLVEEHTGRSGAYQASLRIDEACRDLRRLADETGVDVDLECFYPD